MLGHIISMLRSRRRALVVIPLTIGILAFLIVNGQPRLYAGQARLMIGQEGQTTVVDQQRITKTYAELATSYPVLAAVATDLQLEVEPRELSWRVEAQPVQETNLLELRVLAESPERAAVIANTLADQLIRQGPSGLQGVEGNLQRELQQQIAAIKSQIAETQTELAALDEQIAGAAEAQRSGLELRRDLLQGRIGDRQQTLASLYETYRQATAGAPTLIEQALPNHRPVAPNPWRAALLSMLAALLLAPAVLLVVERRYFTVKQPRDIAAAITGPLLGTLPLSGLPTTEERDNFDNRPSFVANSYESLRINLQMRSRDPLQLLVITDADPHQRAPSVAAQLALTMARIGTRVILIDANLHAPRLHTLLRISNRVGLSTILNEEDDQQLHQAITDLEPNLQVVPAGPPVVAADDHLAGDRLRLLLWVLQQEADILIVIAPNRQQSLALMQEASGVLLVADYGRTRRQALRKTYRRLLDADVQILGVALDRVSPQVYPSFAGSEPQQSRWKGLRKRSKHTRDPYAALVERRYAMVRIPINLSVIAGCCLMLYGGGLYADAAYEQQAARGDNHLPAAAVEVLLPSEPDAFVVPLLNPFADPAKPAERQQPSQRSTLTRLIIPRIGVDTKVIEVAQQLVDTGEQQVLVWQVAKYAVGHHQGSANPGGGSNIVLAGHVGGAAPVFKDLIMLEPGDQLTLYSEGRQYLYSVTEKTVLQEIGVPDEVRRDNARYMDATDEELVTLITCWPPEGPERYNYRIIVRAAPYSGLEPPTDNSGTNWGVR